MYRTLLARWLSAVAWLAFLGPFFFLSYNFANRYASERAFVPSIVFDWESAVPFLGWTILPYWSSDILYGLSLAVCRSRRELNRHALRLLAIQIFSVACFIVFPLKCILTRPPVHGWQASLFNSLASFDQPFNQAPSLHVSLAVILWTEYRKHLKGVFRPLAAGWFALVALSTWTTYQHHFIDIPTGLWAGILMTAALPEHNIPESRRVKLAAFYLAGTVVLAAAAFNLRDVWWTLLWPSFSLSMVAAAYWTGDPSWLGKRNGRMPFWMWPYAAGAWLNSRIWTRGQASQNQLADQVWIGRAPSRGERQRLSAIVDLTAELHLHSSVNIPILDLSTPSIGQIDAGVAAIERTSRQGPVLVCCALGYSRSALMGAAWLLASGRATSALDAIECVRRARPQVVLGPESIARLQQWAEIRNGPQV